MRPRSLAARQRIAVVAGLAGATLLAWAYLLWLDAGMRAAMEAGAVCEVASLGRMAGAIAAQARGAVSRA